MHGIERIRNMREAAGTEGGLTRIRIRYKDGRVLNFVPDAGRPVFHPDDILELERVVQQAASAAEWAEVNDRSDL